MPSFYHVSHLSVEKLDEGKMCKVKAVACSDEPAQSSAKSTSEQQQQQPPLKMFSSQE